MRRLCPIWQIIRGRPLVFGFRATPIRIYIRTDQTFGMLITHCDDCIICTLIEDEDGSKD